MVLCIALSAAGHAHSYPTKNIRMIVQFAPGGQGDIIARDIAARWNNELNRILQLPEVRERLTADGIEIDGGPAERFREVLARDVPKWQRVVKLANIKLGG